MKKIVKTLLEKYKRILKLRGWKFEIIYSEDTSCFAEVIPFINEKRAIIKINPDINVVSSGNILLDIKFLRKNDS